MNRDADARGQLQHDAVERQLFLERGQGALGDPLGLVDIPEIGHEQGELVTAKPGERIARGDRRFDLSGHVTKHPIADFVAQRVVDVLESIEVEQRQPDENSGPAGIAECLFETVAQQRAIG